MAFNFAGQSRRVNFKIAAKKYETANHIRNNRHSTSTTASEPDEKRFRLRRETQQSKKKAGNAPPFRIGYFLRPAMSPKARKPSKMAMAAGSGIAVNTSSPLSFMTAVQFSAS